ncbi:MAG TPA: S26 family signal peptidase [Pirellulales bacterium]|nr:S26 family signal peptidase [Pirellulales bacterium]
MPMRMALRILIGVAILALVAQTWLVMGVVAPVVVAGGSMAPNLVGEHYHVVCRACGRPFDCGLESLPSEPRALCPSCGSWCALDAAEVKPGERLLVDRTAFARSAPRRWSLVVCPLPEDSDRLCVKRVVGLPGERISLTDGDVYVNGKILRKDWDVLQSMSILVDSADYQAQGTASRWRADRADSGWHAEKNCLTRDEPSPAGSFNAESDGKSHDASLPIDPSERIDWLTYHHEQIWRQGAAVVRRTGPIVDDLAYNQSESRELLSVPDVVLACKLKTAGRGKAFLRMDDGRKQFVVRTDLATRQGDVRDGENVLASFVLPSSLDFGLGCAVASALADCRLQLRVAGEPVVDYRYDPQDCGPRRPTAEPVAIGVADMRLVVSDWMLSRDIYYLPPPGKAELEARQLDANEYWLLGDNTAVSEDSRTWPGTVHVTRDALIGSVLSGR